MSVTVRNKIIEELFQSKDFKECISKMQPFELQEDLKSEVILILLEHSDEKIIQLYNSGGLKFYAVRIILNLIQSKTSPFYKKYRQPICEFKENLQWHEVGENDHMLTFISKRNGLIESESSDDYDIRLANELKEEKVMKIIEGLYWYDRELVKLYVQLGTYRAIEEATQIPWRSCYDTIQAAISKIRYELRTNKN